MMVQTHKVRALDLWLLDLALTVLSFFAAYELRVLLDLRGHAVMPIDVYLPALTVVVPAWAIVLPLFGVYSVGAMKAPEFLWPLSKAIGIAWLIAVAGQFAIERLHVFAYAGASRLVLVFMLAIDLFLLAAYRLLLIRRIRHSAGGRGLV
jgi:hypothetical protein